MTRKYHQHRHSAEPNCGLPLCDYHTLDIQLVNVFWPVWHILDESKLGLQQEQACKVYNPYRA